MKEGIGGGRGGGQGRRAGPLHAPTWIGGASDDLTHPILSRAGPRNPSHPPTCCLPNPSHPPTCWSRDPLYPPLSWSPNPSPTHLTLPHASLPDPSRPLSHWCTQPIPSFLTLLWCHPLAISDPPSGHLSHKPSHPVLNLCHAHHILPHKHWASAMSMPIMFLLMLVVWTLHIPDPAHRPHMVVP